MRITVRLIIHYHSACGRNWRIRTHRANVTNRHIIKTVEKFGKDSPTVFIYRFNGIPASSYPWLYSRRSSENISKSIESPMPEVWTYNNTSRHFIPRYDVPVVILLCCIVNFMFLLNWWLKIIYFLRISKIDHTIMCRYINLHR